MVRTHILGFPRIGPKREMKKAVEAYWSKKIGRPELVLKGKEIKKSILELQRDKGLDLITIGDFTWYDHVLDVSIMFNVIPERFKNKRNDDHEESSLLDLTFRMGRGRAPTGSDAPACSMTKWFDTNYHYMVPEFVEDQHFVLSFDDNKLMQDIEEAISWGFDPSKLKPVIVGPVTYLYLGSEKKSVFNRASLLPKLLPLYAELLAKLRNQFGIEWVHVDEPLLGLDFSEEWRNCFVEAYSYFSAQAEHVPKILVATYFVGIAPENVGFVANLPVGGLHLDLVRDPRQIYDFLPKLVNQKKIISLGVVDGRNIWRNDLAKTLEYILSIADNCPTELIWVATSCSLLHCPVDLAQEKKMKPELKQWMAFALQKVDEVVLLAKALAFPNHVDVQNALEQSVEAFEAKRRSTLVHDKTVQERLAGVKDQMFHRKMDYRERSKVQKALLQLPMFPTTTIGSFPQTSEIRSARNAFKAGKMAEAEYIEAMQKEIKFAVEMQEELELDVLVHGEPERTDMVEYFGELLDGFALSENGWVQSYGSRCVKPPIIYGDVKRAKSMTGYWISYAQSLTRKPMKGMLTGPVTILCWSFERDDMSSQECAYQIALALRDEVLELERAFGINIIQIDEPAFREGLPLRKKEQADYLAWAVKAFKLSTGGNELKNSTQIHTHMCYSDFNILIQSIADMDADVITIETSRADMKLLNAFETFNYPNEIGPGVYDIHSPRVPTEEDMLELLLNAAKKINRHKIWVNPDCGLKTRGWQESLEALKKMVSAAKKLRMHFNQY